MPRARTISETVKDLEFELAKQKAVQNEFPNAKVHYFSGFQSKDVNQKYTKFEFERRKYGIWVVPYCEVWFVHNEQPHTVRVHSAPRASRLAYLSYNYRSGHRIMRFSRLAINLKNNQFKDDMINSCRAEIMSFIKNNPGCKMDDKHLEPRLKKLLIFT